MGLELFLAGGYFELVDWLVGQGKQGLRRPQALRRPRDGGRRRPPAPPPAGHLHHRPRQRRHPGGGLPREGGLKILAVTVLTSLDRGDLDDLGFQVDVAELVLSRARRALAIGCDGVISSGLEARALRESLGERLLIVTPGIRPVENRPADDQKRVVTVEERLPQRRRLHRGRPAHPQRRRPLPGGARHPDEDQRPVL